MMWKTGKRRRGGSQEAPSLAGIVLRPEAAKQEENRIYTLFLKGILVYLFVMGGIGSFLSAFDVEYFRFIVNLIVFLIAICCSMLYYNKYTMNIGYLAVMALMAFSGFLFSRYINSGFYAVMNEVTKAVSDFFETGAMRNYGEQVGNRQLAVTISSCFIGGVCSVLLSIMISRKMRHLLAALMSFGMLLIPVYLEREPDGVYTAMLFTALVTASLFCGSGHVRLTQNNARYQYLPEKKRISYVLCVRVMAALMAAVFLLCLFLTQFLPVFYSKEKFQREHSMSALKESTLDTVENFSVLGLMGLFNFYPNTGGMTGGTLGGVSSVRLDFETDLQLEFAPYSQERLYLKTFTGGTYLPYQNKWSRLADENGLPVLEGNETFQGLRAKYEENGADAARGLIRITNVAAPAGAYLPYYAEDTNRLLYPGQTVEYVYYPLLSGEVLEGADEDLPEGWLDVPEQNLEAVAAFCEEAGLSADMDASGIAARLAAYYQEEIPYTLRPGMTPYRKDFINYFLAENRRGYCAHFASAATLVFRYLGIPARYVEGYAVDSADISENGSLLEGARYEDYYEGRSLLGTEAVVSVELTDANAHAWVEIYDNNVGWVTVEVTPASEEEESGESLWQRLIQFLTGNQGEEAEEAQDEAEQEGDGPDGGTGRRIGNALWLAAALLLPVAAGRWIWGILSKRRRYLRANRNEKLVIRYQEYIHKIARRQRELTQKVNHAEQVCWLAEKGFWTGDGEELQSCITILEKAGFSRTEISEEEFQRVMGHLQ